MATQKGGLKVAIKFTPQAQDDYLTIYEDDFLNGSASTDQSVLDNDGGGSAAVIIGVWAGDQVSFIQGNLSSYVDIVTGVPLNGAGLEADLGGGESVSLDSAGNVTFTSNDDYESLSEGETADVGTFTYIIRMGNGAFSVATATITIIGENDGVSIVADSTDAIGAVMEDTPTPATVTLSDTGTIAFTDPDLSDTHTASFSVISNALGGTLVLDPVSEAANAADGSVGWTYNVANAATQYLAANQSVDETFKVTIDDGHGSTVDQTVTVTVTGVNDLVSIVAGSTDAIGAVMEDTPTPAAVTLSDTGTIAFTDPDLIDVHTATYIADVGNTLGGTLSFGAAVESPLTEGGSIGWTYTVNNSNAAVQALGAGVQAVEAFDVVINDGHSTAHQTVSVTVTGVNDLATISVVNTDSASFTEDNGGPYTAGGQLQVSDIDTGENVFAAVAPGALNGTYGTFTFDSANGQWGYTLNNAGPAVQALTSAQTVTDTLTVLSLDGTDSHDIIITINGADEAPTLVVASLPDTYTGADPYDNDGLGLAGHQTLSGGPGNSTLYGGAGSDTLNGNSGNDTLYGGSGDDTLNGNNDDDTLYGGSGTDTASGSNGTDLVIGGYGADIINASADDTIKYLSTLDTNDTINGFVSGGTNKIDLSAIDSGAPGGAFLFHAADIGGQYVEAHTVTWHASGGNVEVYADTDGVLTTAEFHITLAGIGSVQQADFIL